MCLNLCKELIMLPRWGRTITNLSRVGLQNNLKFGKDFIVVSSRSYAKVAVAATDSVEEGLPSAPPV
jgi:hypothetical protein